VENLILEAPIDKEAIISTEKNEKKYAYRVEYYKNKNSNKNRSCKKLISKKYSFAKSNRSKFEICIIVCKSVLEFVCRINKKNESTKRITFYSNKEKFRGKDVRSIIGYRTQIRKLPFTFLIKNYKDQKNIVSIKPLYVNKKNIGFIIF